VTRARPDEVKSDGQHLNSQLVADIGDWLIDDARSAGSP
jgi:hypothetical protein